MVLSALGIALFALGLLLAVLVSFRGRRQGQEALRLLVTPPLTGELQLLYQRLRRALPDCHIFPQVGLDHLLRFTGNPRQRVRERQAQLRGHCVDFAICDAEFGVLAVVEVEDVVLGDPDLRMRADLLKEAGVPVLSWNTARLPDEDDIRDAIAELATLRQIDIARGREEAAEQEETPALELAADDEPAPPRRSSL